MSSWESLMVFANESCTQPGQMLPQHQFVTSNAAADQENLMKQPLPSGQPVFSSSGRGESQCSSHQHRAHSAISSFSRNNISLNRAVVCSGILSEAPADMESADLVRKDILQVSTSKRNSLSYIYRGPTAGSTPSSSKLRTSFVSIHNAEKNGKKRKSLRAKRGRRTSANSKVRCPVCSDLYSRKDNLQAHMRLHTGEMPYRCSMCSESFRWLNACRAHELKHKIGWHDSGAYPDLFLSTAREKRNQDCNHQMDDDSSIDFASYSQQNVPSSSESHISMTSDLKVVKGSDVVISTPNHEIVPPLVSAILDFTYSHPQDWDISDDPFSKLESNERTASMSALWSHLLPPSCNC